MKSAHSLQLTCTAYLPDQIPQLREKPVLFLGRSNVGKSSLLNALGGGQQAKVSKQPGKTRSINFYRWGKGLSFVDLPGYGYAKRSKQERGEWGDLVAAFMDRLPAKGLAFLLMDCRRILEEEELNLIWGLAERGFRVEILFTKVDRLGQAERQKSAQAVAAQWREENLEGNFQYRYISVRNREGLKELFQILNQYEKETDLPASPHD